MGRVFSLTFLATFASAQPTRSVIFQAIDTATERPFVELTPAHIDIVRDGETVPAVSLRLGISPVDLALVFDQGAASIETSRVVALGARVACRELDDGDRLAAASIGKDKDGLQWQVHSPFAAGSRALAYAVERAIRKPGAPAGLALGRKRVSSIESISPEKERVKVYDGIFESLRLFPEERDPSRRRALLIVTNSRDGGSAATLASVLMEAKRRGVAIFSFTADRLMVQVGTYADLADDFMADAQHASEQLGVLANATGGEARSGQPDGYTLRQLVVRIRLRYIAEYVSAGEAGETTVRLSPAGARTLPDIRIGGIQ